MAAARSYPETSGSAGCVVRVLSHPILKNTESPAGWFCSGPVFLFFTILSAHCGIYQSADDIFSMIFCPGNTPGRSSKRLTGE
ncbi:MAG: hypothetical protein M0Q92_09150 [Methanoregula sp.]|jgi:hypothetical protein|nr:hypothetical protein [Methanoregula sp.]